ncbi:DUF177 domain-containing protein [Actibacterium sp. 188UL27-1]|uniref:YceD family protein n=1 Tax=Actibacterium sp. 188UL27-1 TaxID=2786961 RepID=UPI001956C871|nr:YceD family protein [Actibacterium sp. 188UL27-1]MBM7067312.1 DUF177 domain-containing protein [Actibacterium sp. 188UL27-1]
MRYPNAADDPDTVALAKIPHGKPFDFRLVPDQDLRDSLMAQLDLLDLRKVVLEGQLSPRGQRDWALTATLGATAIQPCSVTLQPVTTRVDTVVERLYLADLTAPTEAEAEMPEDDREEPLPEIVNLADLMAEALALALPDYPRAADADLGTAIFTEPGAEPLRDEDLKPFAGLADLKNRLEKG